MRDDLRKGAPLPASMGLCADMLYEVRELRLLMEKEVEAVKARESEIREYIIANLSKSDDTGAAGKHHRAQIVTKEKPRAVDWPQVHAFIQQTGRFDLLQKRLADVAVMDMLEQGVSVPGVERINVVDVSITKI